MSIPTTAPKHLWQAARDFLCTFFNFVGHPADLAAKRVVDAKTHAHLIAWLRAGEHFLRRLLLVEAHALPVPPPCRRQSAGTPPAREPHLLDTSNPETWRTSLRLLERRRLAGGEVRFAPPSSFKHNAGEEPALQVHPTFPLARRYEALLRAFNNPLPIARRLARSLARAPQRAEPLRARPHQPKRKSGDPAPYIDIIGREPWRDLEGLLPALANSS